MILLVFVASFVDQPPRVLHNQFVNRMMVKHCLSHLNEDDEGVSVCLLQASQPSVSYLEVLDR
jgi:hypothetical protein